MNTETSYENELVLMSVCVISHLQAALFEIEICDWITDWYKYSIDPRGRAENKRVRSGSGVAWYLSHQSTVEPRNDIPICVFWRSLYI
jgi:hypothetical protein